jgi:hypothetical protein
MGVKPGKKSIGSGGMNTSMGGGAGTPKSPDNKRKVKENETVVLKLLLKTYLNHKLLFLVSSQVCTSNPFIWS